MQSRKLLLKAVLFLSLCSFGLSVYAAPVSKELSKNDELYPQGWSVGDQVKFKKDTSVLQNDDGTVISGILASDTFLRPQGWQRIINDYYFVSAYTSGRSFFPRHYRYWNSSNVYSIALPSYGHVRYKGGTAVTFSKQGTVVSGTVASDVTIGIGEGQYGFVTFKSGTIIDFYDNGAVKMGTLAEDTKLRPVGWHKNSVVSEGAGFVEFAAKSSVGFTTNGEVATGTPKKRLQWKNNGSETEFADGKAIVFTEQGAMATVE